jgi:AraC-like DNA-binding protein
MLQLDNKPVLANFTGHYRESLPIADLRSHFLCRWSRKGLSGSTTPVAVVPDGCVDLLWSQGKLMVAGPDTAPQLVDPAMATIVGIRFAPGAATRWLGIPMSELVNCRVDLSELWGSRADAIADSLRAAQSTQETVLRFEAVLSDIAPTIRCPDVSMALAFRRLANLGQHSCVASLAYELNISERTLRRQCQHHFGYGPKTLERILRFQRFLKLARQVPEIGLGALAFAADYADQAHLSREVKALSGVSPGMLMQQIAA